jgi:hypothetical protein
LIAGAVVVVAAVVVTLVATTGDDDGGRPAAATTAQKKTGGYDLSTPRAAAESFVAAAKTGSGDKLLALACVGRPACVREHGLTGAELTEAQDTIREGVFELAVHLEKAEFATPVDGDEPGTKEVPYRTPEMTGDAYLSLTFVKSGGDWLYYRPAAS